MKLRTLKKLLRQLTHTFLVIVGACGFTAGLFFVLPLIQAIASGPTADTQLTSIDTANLPPPPPMVEEEPEQQEEEKEEPPKLEQDIQPLDLSQLELALEPGVAGNGILSGDFGLSLKTVASTSKEVDDLFSMAELDQKPRAIYQPAPVTSARLRKKAPATVYILFVVDQRGRVQNAKIQKSTDSSFDRSALGAVKKWKFEPGKRNGKAVRFRMRVPITFPKGN